MITYTDGDLIESDEPIVAHGCNTQGFMGSGIARQIRDTFPDVYAQYRKACDNKQFVLGSVLPVWTRHEGFERCVIQLGTQDRTGNDASEWAVFLSFANLAQLCEKANITKVAIPRIGAAIGGLRWDRDVLPTINSAMGYVTKPIDLVVYDIVPFKETNA